MPRPSFVRVAMTQYKGKASFLKHEIPRNDFFDKNELRYPIYSRLPEYWRKQYETLPPIINERRVEGKKRPHHDGLWYKDEQGIPARVKNYRIKVTYTDEVKKGLWAGEGVIKGLRHQYKPLHERTWNPKTHMKTFWSEVLERHVDARVTPRTLQLIDELYGFDNYILKTPEYELCSTLGSSLKREMLLRLLDKDNSMYLNDPEKREKVYKKYEKFMMPREQAEWVGLTLREAMQKQWDLEKAKGLHDPKPLLEVYTEQLKERLNAEKTVEFLPEEKTGDDSNSFIFQPPK